MAKGRMIESDTWEDDFFNSLSMFERLLWVGIITGAADDQGRFQDNAAIIRSKVFPTEDILLSQVDDALNRYSSAGKITRYIAGNKKLIQINNWWKHQTPRWAGRSNYSAPLGWVDRVRCHTTGNELVTEHWDSKGGYLADYIASNTINDVKEDDDVKDDVKDEDEAALDSFSIMQRMIEKLTGYPAMQKDILVINEFIDRGVIEEDIKAALLFLNGKKTVRGASDLRGSVFTALGKRVQSVVIDTVETPEFQGRQ